MAVRCPQFDTLYVHAIGRVFLELEVPARIRLNSQRREDQMGIRKVAFCIFIGLAGICIATGILLVLAERKKNKKRRFGHALLVLAAVFVVIAIEFLLWPGSS